MKPFFTTSLTAIAVFAAAPLASAQVAYFSDSGVKDVGNPQALGGVNNTGQSVAFELIFDFTTTVDNNVNPIVLWELGATGNGAALVLDGDDLFFWAGNSNDDFVTGAHGLTATQTGVQVVSVFDVNGGNELLSLYVNGAALVVDGVVDAAGAWAGSDNGGIGSVRGGAGARFSGTTEIDTANVQNYPTNDISLSLYRLASSGGDASNTLANILVPEPSSLALLSLGGLLLARRRRG